ncbi:uncharacterized protein LOC122994330 isoform X2 [Thunnus albacares]|uniref:uncharacterized protein LOC122994330 isoform X2 n=1 Tax=Thunnus albacares TaxID=8236 RepID=UPI001CF6B3FC|nr:uncharacterized protein LOC122994330 isoform X2 [Thunnus albacares]
MSKHMMIRSSPSVLILTVSRDPSKWLQPGSMALYKVEKLLLNEQVLRDVEKLSHDHQTSSLEGFHSVILHFAPKNVIFPYIGMLCRLYLADMHFNENAERGQATTSEGKAVYKIMFPKSKKGECTAKPVKTKPTFILEKPTRYTEELKQIPIPKDLCAQFERPSKEDVIARHVSRFSRGVAGTQHSGHQDQETPGVSGTQHTTG